MPLLIVFIAVPLAELWLLLKVGSLIGALPTVGLVILTAVIGVSLLRQQGLSALASAQAKMQAGQLPATEMVEGIFLAVGGALLLVPGFMTDAIGLCCLLPGVRHWLVGGILKRAGGRVFMASANFQQTGRQANDSAVGDDKTTIDGEYRREP